MHTDEITSRLLAAQRSMPGARFSHHLFPGDYNPHRVMIWVCPAWGASENKSIAEGKTADECMAALERYVADQTAAPAMLAAE